MKIRIAMTLDVDVEAWADEFGIDTTDVRADVARWAENGLRAQLAEQGLGR